MATETEIVDGYQQIVMEFDKFNDLLKKTELERKAKMWAAYNVKPQKTAKDFEDFQKEDVDLVINMIERKKEAWEKLTSDLNKYTAQLSSQDRILLERSPRMPGILLKKNMMLPLLSDYIYQEMIRKAKSLNELKKVIKEYAFPIVTIVNGRKYDIKEQVLQHLDILMQQPDSNWDAISSALTDTYGIRAVVKKLFDAQTHHHPNILKPTAPAKTPVQATMQQQRQPLVTVTPIGKPKPLVSEQPVSSHQEPEKVNPLTEREKISAKKKPPTQGRRKSH